MQELTVSIHELFAAVEELENANIVNPDYTGYKNKSHIEIETPDGFAPVKSLCLKKSPTALIQFDDGTKSVCANQHMLFNTQGHPVFAQDVESINLNFWNKATSYFHKKVTQVTTLSESDWVYDCEVDTEKHLYITSDGLIHHNTSITAGLSYVYGQMGYKVITIVPSDDLVTQTYDWYELLQMDVGTYSGSEKDINHQYVVATWQALQNNLDIMKSFDVLIFDECHGLKAQVAQKIVNEAGAHIAFRFGVTGTFPKADADKMSLHSSVGEIVKTIPASWLIENGYLSTVEIQPIELNETYIDEEFPDYTSEKAFLSKSTSRMEMIANIIVSIAIEHGNTLILVNSIPFGEKLAALIKGAVFLYGESSKDLRKEHYDMFDKQDDLIVIASVGIASTGISIDRVFALGMIDAGKSFFKAIQTVGRGLRVGRDKNSVYVFDVYSKLKWAKKHFNERQKFYKEAQYPVLKKQTLKVK